MDSAARSERNCLSVQTGSSVVSRYSSATSNGSSRPRTIATSGGNAQIKLSSPQNLGLLGPICWRGTRAARGYGEVNQIRLSVVASSVCRSLLNA